MISCEEDSSEWSMNSPEYYMLVTGAPSFHQPPIVAAIYNTPREASASFLPSQDVIFTFQDEKLTMHVAF